VSGEIIHLPSASGSYIGSFEIWRLPEGTIYGHLTEMPPRVVEALPGEVPEKMQQIAELFEQAAISMREQAEALR